MLRGVILVILLAHLHLVAGLGVDRLLKDASEDIFLVLNGALLVNSLLAFLAGLHLSVHLGLLGVDLLVAVHLEFVILSLDLLLLRLLLVFVVHVVDVGVSDQFITVPFFVPIHNLSLLVVVVDEDELLVEVELSLFDLVRGRDGGIQFELLRHLVDEQLLAVVVLFEAQGLLV